MEEDAMAEKLLLSAEEAFERLGIGRAFGFKLIASGALPSIKVGRLRRVPAERLRDWVDKQVEAQNGAAEK
jgi:excisionase family DNA binding protein